MRNKTSDHRAPKAAGFLLALAALTLFGASAIHFGVAIPVGSGSLRDPFAGAAIPEAVLGVIVGGGAISLVAGVGKAWTVGVGTTVFAILVVLYGLSITVRSGRGGDVVYHSALLLILVVAGTILLRHRRRS